MGQSFHGHDVMRMMLEENKPFTPESLESAIIERFGEDARFHTCSAENMTPKELIGFLSARGKFVAAPGGISMKAENICDH